MQTRLSALLGGTRKVLLSLHLQASFELIGGWLSGSGDKRLRPYILLLITLAIVTLVSTSLIFRAGAQNITSIVADFVHVNEIGQGADQLVVIVSDIQLAGLAYRTDPSDHRLQVWEQHLAQAKGEIVQATDFSTGGARVLFVEAQTDLLSYELNFRDSVSRAKQLNSAKRQEPGEFDSDGLIEAVLVRLEKIAQLTHDQSALAAQNLLAARDKISTQTLIGITFIILFASGLFALIIRKMGQLTHEAQLSSRTKSEFLSVMSHELRTPLNAIIGFSDIMKEEMLGPIEEPQYKEYLVDINRSGHHLLQLINDILEFARMDRNAVKTNLTRVSVSTCARRAERFLIARAANKGVKITSSVAEGLEALADETMLRKIFVQLIDNAIKFTPAGGKVSIRGERHHSGGVAITVEDTGIGIPRSFLSKVTQPFFQVAHGHTRPFDGKGLGLAIVKQLVEMNRGQLEIQSEEGKGTRATVILPGTETTALLEVA
jgi:signal transduction histidine kinase